MPSQLYNNSAVYFMCARDFLWDGVEYEMGETFDQDIAPGRLDMLIRTRRLFAVVDDAADKPRHWHHHIWPKSQIEEKLGLAEGTSSAYNKPEQIGIEFASVETDKNFIDQDKGAELLAIARANAATQKVLDGENAERFDDGCVGEHDPAGNPDCDMAPAEPEDDEPAFGQEVEDDEGNVVIGALEDEEDEEEPAVTEEDLWDPEEHTVVEVNEYLDGDISEEERARVIAVEQAGKNRKGIVNNV